MSKATKIQWTNRTWNPLRGCTRVSEGCRHCYAETLAGRFCGPGQAYEGLVKITPNGPRWTNTIRLMPEKLVESMTWRKPAMVFVNSTSDLFHPDVPFDFIDKVFAVMALCPQHTFQVLTKRPERMREYLGAVVRPMTADGAQGSPGVQQFTNEWMASREHQIHNQIGPMSNLGAGAPPGGYNAPGFKAWNSRRLALLHKFHSRYDEWPLSNVWLGTSVEDQKTADERLPPLLATPAAVRFVSYEPALGPVDFFHFDDEECALRGPGVIRSGGMTAGTPHEAPEGYDDSYAGLDWVIVGGESGPGARPFDVAWARSVVDQCRTAGVPVFVKQLGAAPFSQTAPAGGCSVRSYTSGTGWYWHLADRKGGDMAEWPEDLRVREFPSPSSSLEGAAL